MLCFLGCCDGNPADDLRLPNGTVMRNVEDIPVFLYSWMVDTSEETDYFRRVGDNCTTGNCTKCFQMLNQTPFSKCHHKVLNIKLNIYGKQITFLWYFYGFIDCIQNEVFLCRFHPSSSVTKSGQVTFITRSTSVTFLLLMLPSVTLTRSASAGGKAIFAVSVYVS